MNWRYNPVGFLLILFLASCNLLPAGTLPTENTPEPTVIAGTPAYPGPKVSATAISPVDPSATPVSTVETPTPEAPTQIPTLTPTEQLDPTPTAPRNLLDVQTGSPVGIPNFAHPELGCQWMGVAGQVFDTSGTPLEGMVIEFGGNIAGDEIFGLTILGQTETYGPGGYEFKLGDHPVLSNGTVWARVYDFEGVPLSEDTYFNTYGDCDQNLIILNFVQAFPPPTDWVYLPLIR